MSRTTFVTSVELTTINCGCCGGTYAINETYREKAYKASSSWTCPYCKVGWGYAAKNGETEQLKKKLADLEKQNKSITERAEYLQKEGDHFRKSRDAIKGQLTQVKKRIHAGVCPCCNRSFLNLVRHMQIKHAEVSA